MILSLGNLRFFSLTSHGFFIGVLPGPAVGQSGPGSFLVNIPHGLALERGRATTGKAWILKVWALGKAPDPNSRRRASRAGLEGGQARQFL